MKSLTIAISLRILLILTFSLRLFDIKYHGSPGSLSSSNFYLSFPFWLVLLLILFQQHHFRKNSPDGRFIMKEMILPEFNSNDEREAELTGIAAKDAFSALLIFTPIAFFVLGISLILEGMFPQMMIFLAVSSIPISGLIAYYFSYRHHYLQ